MTDSAVNVTQGSGTSIDTRTEATNGNHRQVIIIGDPSVTNGVAPVDGTAGLKVNLGADNDVTLSELPDTSAGDLAAINATLAGTLTVDGSGSTQPVSGTVTANLSSTDNAVLNDIKTAVESALPAGSNTIGNVTSQITAAIPAGTNALGKIGHDITGIGHGVKTVTTAGTDVALASSTSCKRIVIQAQTDNTGLIAVGGSGVDATVATGTGVILYPGDSFELEIDNLADVYIDSTVNGEGVRFTYFD